MNFIDAKELKKRLDAGDKIMLVNAMEENKFRAKHIPGSLNLFKKEDIQNSLQKTDNIVVYCTDKSCNKSILLYYLLEAMGYQHVQRFAGGLLEWENCGFRLEGEMIN